MEINNFTHYKFEGWLPNDWEVKDAADVCIKITDGTHDTPKVVDSGIPFITAIHVKKGKIDFDNCLYISEEEHEKIYKRCNPSKGDLLVVNIGAGVAEYAFVETDKEFSLKNVALLKPNSDLLHDKYLCYHHAYKKENIAHRVKSGGAQPFLSLKELRKLKIVLPPLPEQQKIAKILSTWDKAIDSAERLIANSKQQKKALMQQLLTGKKRLLDEDGKRFEDEWKSQLFKKTLKLDRGSSPRPIVNYTTESEDGVNWIKIGDTKGDGLYINSTKEKITPEGAKKSRKVSKGEIILSNSMSYGKPYILNIDGYIHDGWFVIRDYEKHLDKSYLIQILSSELIQMQYKRLAAGGVVSNISSELVYSVKIDIPSIPEQQKIAAVLTNADKEIELLEQQLAGLQQEKKALMQVLLTGKKRVRLND